MESSEEMNATPSVPQNNNPQPPQQATPKLIGSKKRKPQKVEMDPEARLDQSIMMKKQLMDQVYGIESDEFALNNEEDEDRLVLALKRRNDALQMAFEMDHKQRMKATFKDSETNKELMEDIISVVPDPIIVLDMDLEPLNQMLTDYINKPDPGTFSCDYLLPEFGEIKDMLAEIKAKGDCPLYEQFVPKEGTEQYENYVENILCNIREKIRVKRYAHFMEEWEQGFHQATHDLVKAGKMKLEDIPEEFIDQSGPSTSNKTFSETLRQMKVEGEIVKEAEPEDDTCEYLDVISEADDAQSDVASEVSTPSTATVEQQQSAAAQALLALNEDTQDSMKSEMEEEEEVIQLESDSDTDYEDEHDSSDSDGDVEIIDEEMEEQQNNADEHAEEEMINETLMEGGDGKMAVDANEKVHKENEGGGNEQNEPIEDVAALDDSILAGQSATSPMNTSTKDESTMEPPKEDEVICIDSD